MNNLSGVRNFY